MVSLDHSLLKPHDRGPAVTERRIHTWSGRWHTGEDCEDCPEPGLESRVKMKEKE